MRVILAKTSGFCHGVKRAMAVAVEASARHGGLDADGPLVHNRQAIALLRLHGVSETPGENRARPVLIRAHGVPPGRRRQWREAGREIVDATCVHVARNQRLAAAAAERGALVIIAGDPDHAEVQAVAASAGVHWGIVGSPADIRALPAGRKIFLLAQTTFNAALFAEMAALLRTRFPDCEVAGTICQATGRRQEEAARLASRVEAMVVVGGVNSANTRRLAEIVQETGKPVFSVETADELREQDFAAFSRVGVISGASTPGWITQDVVNRLRSMGRRTVAAWCLSLLQILVLSRVSTALAATGLTLAAGRFLLGRPDGAAALAGGCYVFFAHTLNRRVPDHPEARRLSLVDVFYQERRFLLLMLAWLALALSIGLTVRRDGGEPGLFLLVCAATAAYAAFRRRAAGSMERFRIRVLPRAFCMAAGWAIVLVGLCGGGWREPAASLGSALFVFLICFGGTLVRDLQDVASDSLMGMGTIPARLGVGKTRLLARGVLGAALVLCLVAAAAALQGGDTGMAAFLCALVAVPALGIAVDGFLARGGMRDAIFLQAGVDGMGCLAGMTALGVGGWA